MHKKIYLIWTKNFGINHNYVLSGQSEVNQQEERVSSNRKCFFFIDNVGSRVLMFDCVFISVSCSSFFFSLSHGLISKVTLILKRNIWYIDSISRFVLLWNVYHQLSVCVCVWLCAFVVFIWRVKIISNHELVGRERLIVWFHYKKK